MTKLALAACTVTLVTACSDPKPPSRDELLDNRDTRLWVQCRRAVREQLKSPSTADIAFWDRDVQTSGNRLKISSYLDAQNSFGVMIRSNFSCTWELPADGSDVRAGDWKLTDVTIAD
jgi:hypothetical protein